MSGPIKMAVVWPHSKSAVDGVFAAVEDGIIDPVFIGDPDVIEQWIYPRVKEANVVGVDNEKRAGQLAVQLVREGHAEAIMKGTCHTSSVLSPVLSREHGIRTNRRLSHVSVIDTEWRRILISDAAINTNPDLLVKRDIIKNAITVADALDIDRKKVAVLSAVETVSVDIQSGIDAALLSKMAERGQIPGAIVEGPLAIDDAISVSVAASKNIHGRVAGQANILIAPNLDAANILVKLFLMLPDRAEFSGIVVGAQVPIVITGRSFSSTARLESCRLAKLLVEKEMDR